MKPIDFQQYANTKGARQVNNAQPSSNDEPLSEIKLYTMEQAANLLGVSKTVMYKLTGNGEIPFIKFGVRIRRIRHSDLVAFIERHTLGG
jgi:excisionase family DNA binding protein